MRRTIIIAVLLAVVLLGWIYWQKNRTAALIVSGFIESDVIRVGWRVGGRVAEVLVEEGRRVKGGDPLFRIEQFDLQERLAQANATLAAIEAEHARLKAGFRNEEVEHARARRDQAQATLDKLLAGPRVQDVESAREQLKIAQANLDCAQTEYERLERLRKEAQAAGQKEFDEAVRNLKAGKGEQVR